MQVNYRSNQEILDFANVLLRNIEANQYANIQLQANSLSKVTEKSFNDAVKFSYCRLAKLADFNDVTIESYIKQAMKPYIDEKLDKGEKVTFLAYTRRHISQINEALKKIYPDREIVSLVPEKLYNSTVFSSFIKQYWSEIKFVPSQNIINVIVAKLLNKLGFLVRDKDKSLQSVQKLLGDWRTQYTNTIAAWQNQVANNQLSTADFMENVKESMLSFEIQHNAVKQALLSARNEESKNKDNVAKADFILSTIHSAKGLEFDNVIVIYRNENDMNEEKKRMYYVAFTRAVKSEYILAYDITKDPQILADYRTICERLHERYPDPNSNLKSLYVDD